MQQDHAYLKEKKSNVNSRCSILKIIPKLSVSSVKLQMFFFFFEIWHSLRSVTTLSYQSFQIAKMKMKPIEFLLQTIASMQGTQRSLYFMIPFPL